MHFNEVFEEINKFLDKTSFPFPKGGGQRALNRIQGEFTLLFPKDLKYYITSVSIPDDFQFLRIGNYINLYGYSNMSKLQAGYSFDPITKKRFDEWSDSWFIIAEEGADPIIFDLTERKKVFQANHGEGDWRFFPIANSIPQFLICCAALHYTFLRWGLIDVIDNSNGFCLKEAPASWLFPKMKYWAGEYYDHWCSVFDNA
jgi:hypothetical protein